jgi:hypothetical protein
MFRLQKELSAEEIAWQECAKITFDNSWLFEEEERGEDGEEQQYEEGRCEDKQEEHERPKRTEIERLHNDVEFLWESNNDENDTLDSASIRVVAVQGKSGGVAWEIDLADWNIGW